MKTPGSFFFLCVALKLVLTSFNIARAGETSSPFRDSKKCDGILSRSSVSSPPLRSPSPAVHDLARAVLRLAKDEAAGVLSAALESELRELINEKRDQLILQLGNEQFQSEFDPAYAQAVQEQNRADASGLVSQQKQSAVEQSFWDPWVVEDELKDPEPVNGSKRVVSAVQFSPDGSKVLVTRSNAIEAFDLAEKKNIFRKSFTNIWRRASLFFDSSHILFIAEDRGYYLANLDTNDIRPFQFKPRFVINPYLLKISADRNIFIVGDQAGSLQFYSLKDMAFLDQVSAIVDRPVVDVFVLSDQRTAVIVYEHCYVMRDLKTNTSRQIYTKGPPFSAKSAAVSTDGKTIAIGALGSRGYVFNLGEDEPLFTLDGPAGAVTGVHFSPDNRLIYTISADTRLGVFSAENGQLLQNAEYHENAINSFAVSPDGATIVTGAGDNIAAVWKRDRIFKK